MKQLTIKDAIEKLSKFPAKAPLRMHGRHATIDSVDSYRGYYDHLAIECGGKGLNCGEFIELLKDSMNRVFYGYKGGEFSMNESTPLWNAPYGVDTGLAVVDIIYDGYYYVIICTWPSAGLLEYR